MFQQEAQMAAIDPAAHSKLGCVGSGSKLGKRIALFQALRELECARLDALDDEDYEAARHVEEEIEQVRVAIQRPGPQTAAVPAVVSSGGDAVAHEDPAPTEPLPTAAEGAADAEGTNVLSQEPPPSPELPWAELASAPSSLHSAFRGVSIVTGKDSFAPAMLPDRAFFHEQPTFGLGNAGSWRDSLLNAEVDPVAQIANSTATDALDRPVFGDKASPAPSLVLSRGEVQTTADGGSNLSCLSEQPLPDQAEALRNLDGHPGAADSRSTAVVDSMEEQGEESTLKEECSPQLSEPMLGESRHTLQPVSILLGASLEPEVGVQSEQPCSSEVASARTPPRTEAALVRGSRMHKTPGGTLAKVSPRRATPRQSCSQQASSQPASPRQVSPRPAAFPGEAASQRHRAGHAAVTAEAKTAFGDAAGAHRASIEEEAAALYPLFGEHLTRCVYSERCDVRSAALQRLAVDLRSPAAEKHLSAESVAGGVAKVLMHTFPDRDVEVFLSSAKLLQAACERLAHRQPFDRTSMAGPQCGRDYSQVAAQRLRAWC